MNNTDLIIIGAGPGGYRAAAFAAANGLKVVVFEAAQVGGTCLNEGCIPTKSFARNAEIVQTLKEAATFGLDNLEYDFHFDRVVERKNQVLTALLRQVGVSDKVAEQDACPLPTDALSDDEAVPSRCRLIVFRLLQDTILLLAAQDGLLGAEQRQRALRRVCFVSEKAAHHRHTFRHEKAAIICSDCHPNGIARRTLCQSCIQVACRSVPRSAIGKGSSRRADIHASCRSLTGCKTQEDS